MLFIDQTELVILLTVCTVAAACFIAAISLFLWAIINRRRQKSVREIAEISVDANAVKREFTVGEEFTCDGLIVNAVYNIKPKTEQLLFEVITSDYCSRLSEAGTLDGCYVIKPDMSKGGKDIVIVKYKDKAAYYEISIVEPVQEPVQEEIAQEEPVQEEALQEEPQAEPAAPSVLEEPAQEIVVQRQEPIIIEEESYESVLRYDRSFMARYIQSSDEIKLWYTKLKNEMLSYKKVRARISWKRESFFFGREIVARFGFRGKTLCIYFPLDPAEYADTKYKVEDVSDLGSYADTPCMYRLKNERRVRYAIELFASVMEKKGGIRIERIAEDYYLPYEGIVELIEKGLAKRIIKTKSDRPIFLKALAAEAAATTIISDKGAAEEQTQADEAQITDAEEEEEDAAPVEEQTEEMPVEEASPASSETPVEEENPGESTEGAEEAVAIVEEAHEQPLEEGSPVEEPVEEAVPEEEGPVETPVEEPVEAPAEPAEEPVEEAEEPTEEPEAAAEAPAPSDEEPVEAPEEPAEEPVEESAEESVEEHSEPTMEETEIEELTTQEIDDVASYEEEEKDEDGIEVIGVMFRRRGRKVYWFDPDGKTWEKGEIALYKSPIHPPQEVIVVDNARLSPSKLHLPLKPLRKAPRRPQPPKKK